MLTNSEMNAITEEHERARARQEKIEERRARRAAMTPRERHLDDAKTCTGMAFSPYGADERRREQYLRQAAAHIEAVRLLDAIERLET